MPGSPDIALPRKKRAVFIDGDFWHGRELERLITNKEPDDFWVAKIQGNIERDKKQRSELQKMGWEIMIAWESDLKRKRTRDEILASIKSFLIA